MKHFLPLAFLGVALLLPACGETIETEARYPTGAERDSGGGNDIYGKKPGIFGSDGISLLGRSKDNGNGTSGIGVNSFLWRAALDTISFMPLSSADPFGGVILTDWYAPIENGNERFKADVLILGRALRSDGIRVRVFKQELRGGAWRDVSVPAEMGLKLEDAILTRARQLRAAQN